MAYYLLYVGYEEIIMFDYNKFYDEYKQASIQEQEKLLDQLKVVMYFNYKVFFKTDTDTAYDFFCYFFEHKLKLIVSNYSDDRTCFFGYFQYMVKMYFYSFLVKKDRKRMYEYYGEDTTAQDGIMYDDYDIPHNLDCIAAETQLEYNAEAVTTLKNILQKCYHHSHKVSVVSKHIEQMLLLKYGLTLGEEKLYTLCSILGLDYKKLFMQVDKLSEKMQQRQCKIRKLEQTVGMQYCRLKVRSHIANELAMGKVEKEAKSIKVKRTKRYWKNACKKYLDYSVLPSNSLVADCLNIHRVRVHRDIKKIRHVVTGLLGE